jgi:hypothetical protein
MKSTLFYRILLTFLLFATLLLTYSFSACTTKQIRPTALNSSSCYLNGSECGAFEVDSLFGNICTTSDGFLADCNTTMTTTTDPTMASRSVTRHSKRPHTTTTTTPTPNLTQKTTIALSMLQMNSKVNNDMNYLISNALNSDDDTLMEQYQNALVNISEFIQVYYVFILI